MMIKDILKKAASTDRSAVVGGSGMSLGQKVLGGLIFLLGAAALIGFLVWRTMGRVPDGTGSSLAAAAIAAAAPQASEPKGPAILDAPPELDKKCPPGIICDAPAADGKPSAPTQSDAELAALAAQAAEARKLADAVTARRLGSTLSVKDAVETKFIAKAPDAEPVDSEMALLQAQNRKLVAGLQQVSADQVNQAQAASASAATPVKVNVSSAAPCELASALTPLATPGTSAGMLRNRSLMVIKGQSSTCTLDTALSSEQLGFVRCILDFPVKSADGKVTMMERGTTIDGEYKKGVDRGVRAAFVLWTRAVTPEGVVIDLDSPATDALGRSGIAGEIDSRFWDRYKGALLFSVLQDVTQISTAMMTSVGVTGPYGVPLPQNTGTTATTAAGEILKRDADIKDVLTVNQGKAVGITFARDLDFSTVYALKLKKKT